MSPKATGPQAAAQPALVDRIAAGNSAAEAFGNAEFVRFDMVGRLVTTAWRTATLPFEGTGSELETAILDRSGRLTGCSGFRRVH